MSQSRRLNGPLYSPVPSLAAANQNQIEDLVQRNKTLDVTHKKLLEEVKQERERHKAELTKLREEHAMQEEEWRRQNHYMLGVARVSRLRAVLNAEDERSKALQETRFIREEKFERIKRDYKLKLFQMGYEELENQVIQMEETKQETEAEHWEEMEQLTGETEELRGTLKAALDELTRVKKASDALQVHYNGSKSTSPNSNVTFRPSLTNSPKSLPPTRLATQPPTASWNG
jgi:DNA repair exonuclease SbcCD ATPase subunit